MSIEENNFSPEEAKTPPAESGPKYTPEERQRIWEEERAKGLEAEDSKKNEADAREQERQKIWAEETGKTPERPEVKTAPENNTEAKQPEPKMEEPAISKDKAEKIKSGPITPAEQEAIIRRAQENYLKDRTRNSPGLLEKPLSRQEKTAVVEKIKADYLAELLERNPNAAPESVKAAKEQIEAYGKKLLEQYQTREVYDPKHHDAELLKDNFEKRAEASDDKQFDEYMSNPFMGHVKWEANGINETLRFLFKGKKERTLMAMEYGYLDKAEQRIAEHEAESGPNNPEVRQLKEELLDTYMNYGNLARIEELLNSGSYADYRPWIENKIRDKVAEIKERSAEYRTAA
jgi:hypothetical protein